MSLVQAYNKRLNECQAIGGVITPDFTAAPKISVRAAIKLLAGTDLSLHEVIGIPIDKLPPYDWARAFDYFIKWCDTRKIWVRMS